MAAIQEFTAAWNATALTKFRIPRLRRDTVARPALLERLLLAAENSPVTLVCAPGGFGKTTLLTQFAHHCLDRARSERAPIWISIDPDDDDRHRFLATLLRAVEPLTLAWDTPPSTLLANAERSESQCRAALAAFVNALCTASSSRILIVLDDLHRIERAETHALIEALVERLPDHVALVLGSRVEPPLPLARWRAHGELAELTPQDLQLTEPEAVALAHTRLGRDPDVNAVRRVLRRTHGWPVGFSLALQSQATQEHAIGASPSERGDRHLFAYLAQEVLAELPEELREFALRCSILAELTPSLCNAVTERDDAKQALEALYRRNLFLTITDEATPVMRFHDLFRDFLEAELGRRHPQLVATLHERAGRAHASLPRAIAHFLAARRWQEAMELIASCGEAMIAAGDHSTLERWIDQLPAEARETNPRMAYLRGVCAWLRWDWPRAKREFEPAIAGLTGAQFAPLRTRAMFLAVDAFISSGDNAQAWQLLDLIEREPLDELSKAQLALQRAWGVLAMGEPQRVLHHLREFVALAEREPGLICPQTADRIHTLCIGLPGIAECFERFFAASQRVHEPQASPWQLAALPVGAWAHFWRGRLEPISSLLERGAALHQQFGSMRLVADRLLQFRSLYLAASGQFEASESLMKALIQALLLPEATLHRAVWMRAYQHGLARLYWMAGRHDAYRELAQTLLAPRAAMEWPFLDVAAELVRGQLAMLRGDWPAAQSALQASLRGHARLRMPMIYGDPRVSSSYVYLKQHDRTQYWHTFAPVLGEVLDQQAIGLLLLEPRAIVAELLQAVPLEVRRTARFDELQDCLVRWQPQDADTRIHAGPLASLSQRELEVLEQVAAGASNKHIARDLQLSLHTVKRHIANILDKLDCASRGQAADLFRRTHATR